MSLKYPEYPGISFPHFHFRIYGIVETSAQRIHDAGKEAAHRPAKRRSKTLTFRHMKRNTLIKHLTKNGAYLIRQGRRHSIYQREEYRTEVPRHTEIVDELARKICKDLNIPFVR